MITITDTRSPDRHIQIEATPLGAYLNAVALGQSQVAAAEGFADNAATSASQAALFNGPWMDNVATLIADTTLSYGPGASGVSVGDYVQTRAEGFSYQVAASTATDHHLTTSGGVKLYVLPDAGGYDIAAWGPVMDGATSDLTLLQAAIDKAADAGRVITGAGTTAIDGKLVLKGACDFTRLTVNVYGAPTVAVEVSTGSATNPTDILDLAGTQIFVLPNIVNIGKPAIGWAGQGIGLRYVNVQNAKIVEQLVANFAVGFQHTAYSNGCGYSSVQAGYARNNKINRQVTIGDDTGWTNRWDIFGGRYFHLSSEGERVAGVHQVEITGPHPFTINSLMFYGGSIESLTCQYALKCGGSYNQFNGMHWERAGGLDVIFDHGGSYNEINSGYAGHTINFTEAGGATGNTMSPMRGARRKSAPGPVDVVKNQSGSFGASYIIMEATADVFNDDPDTDYAAFIGAQKIAGKPGASAHDRLRMDFVNGKFLIGSGSVAPTAGLAAIGTAGVAATGNWYLPTNGAEPGNVGGYCAFWFDGTDLKIRLPGGTIKTVQTV